MRKMNFSVIIPTYRRPQDLRRCLDALKRQERLADEVLVTVREGDSETALFFGTYDPAPLPLQIVPVRAPGVIAAMTAALAQADGDIIALTDDDTAPYPDWLRRMEAHFQADPGIGGVGGRDWQPRERGNRDTVGIVQWHGRLVGNHHLGCGPAREAHVLKGANCAYRAEPLKQIGFDTRLRGDGAQTHWELGLGLAMGRAGWKLIYDPAVALDHFIAPRFDADQNLRGRFNADGIYCAAYNQTLALLTHLPPARRAAFLLWAFLIGTRGDPGLLQIARLAACRDCHLWKRSAAALRGRMHAMIRSCRA